MKTLLSSYACEPEKGSEPGVGWRWANGLADRVELTVLTREGNREVIGRAIAAMPEEANLRKVHFLYYDLPRPFLWAKKRGLLPTLGYYMIWQWAVAKRFAQEAEESDIVHHLTFCTLLCPGFWKLKTARFIVGPVGAPLVDERYLPLFGDKAKIQGFRNRVLRNSTRLPWLRRLLVGAAAVVPANSETRKLLESQGIPVREVMLDTGAPEITNFIGQPKQSGSLRLIYAGQLERRKGIEISLRALALTSKQDGCDFSFDIFGSGPDRDRLVSMTEELGIAKQVKFHGAVPRESLMENFQEADAFLFTSVRDTSGGVNLEAMAHGLPVICIAHQGVGDITDESGAERIPPGSISDTINGLAAAILRMASDPERRARMGSAAAKRANECFPWEEKFDRMVKIYGEAVPR